MFSYFHQLQKVLIGIDFCEHCIDEAFLLIERWRWMENLDLRHFAKGEDAFLKKKYYHSLVAFLHIEDLTYKKILSYRAAGYLCEERGWFEKSAFYLTKSLSLFQADYSSVKLLLTVLQKLGRYEQAKKIEDVLNEIIKPHLPAEKQNKFFSINDGKIAELKQIFQSSPLSTQLFEKDKNK